MPDLQFLLRGIAQEGAKGKRGLLLFLGRNRERIFGKNGGLWKDLLTKVK